MIKPPNPNSNKNLITEAHLPAQSAPSPSYQQTILDLTYFKYEKTRLLASVDQLRQLRTAEHMYKFVSLDRKLQKLKNHNDTISKLKQGMLKLTLEGQNFRNRYDVGQKFKADRKTDYMDFYEYIKGEIETVKDACCTAVESISKVRKLVNTLNISFEIIDMNVDIEIWKKGLLREFEGLQLKHGEGSKGGKPKQGEHDCCRWL